MRMTKELLTEFEWYVEIQSRFQYERIQKYLRGMGFSFYLNKNKFMPYYEDIKCIAGTRYTVSNKIEFNPFIKRGLKLKWINGALECDQLNKRF